MPSDGGPAFPASTAILVGLERTPPDLPHELNNKGMTVKQLYAGLAMEGILSSFADSKIRKVFVDLSNEEGITLEAAVAASAAANAQALIDRLSQ